MKRNIFLFVLLAIPFVIYFFLKFFGQSYYTIPIFYKEGVISAKCNIDFGGQYLIPDPVEFENGNAPRLKLNDQPTVFFVYSRLNPSKDFTFTEITRMVTNKLSQLRIAWIGLTDLETTEINEFGSIHYRLQIIWKNNNNVELYLYKEPDFKVLIGKHVSTAFASSQSAEIETFFIHWFVKTLDKKQKALLTKGWWVKAT